MILAPLRIRAFRLIFVSFGPVIRKFHGDLPETPPPIHNNLGIVNQGAGWEWCVGGLHANPTRVLDLPRGAGAGPNGFLAAGLVG